MSQCLWRLPQQARLIVRPMVRTRLKIRGRPPGEALSLQERLQRLRAPAAAAAGAPVNIGFDYRPADSRRELVQVARRNQADRALERAARDHSLRVPLDEVEAEWRVAHGPEQLRSVAEHYGVFADLFGAGFFTPVLPLRVAYPTEDDRCSVVHMGNCIKPAEARCQPEVLFSAPEESRWTLVCTNLEGCLGSDSPEMVQWMVQNIPGSSVEKGDVVHEYMRPLPLRGTGYHRIVFVLFKQEGVLPSEVQSTRQNGDLSARAFSTEQFYRQHEDVLTPAGLAFFQTDWDFSVTEFFHRELESKEPVFEYEFRPPYIRRQRWFPKGESVSRYFDKYADPRDLHKQMLLKRLSKVHPFQGVTEGPKYPLAVPKERGARPPTWIINEQRKEARKISKYYYVDRREETVFDPHV